MCGPEVGEVAVDGRAEDGDGARKPGEDDDGEEPSEGEECERCMAGAVPGTCNVAPMGEGAALSKG